MAEVPKIKLNNGLWMPAFGLGTYASRGGEGVKAIKKAIDVGYRHFDTAFLYNNEPEVGEAIRSKVQEGVVKREDCFVVTKLWCTYHDPERVEYACRKSLENLGLDYIDMYLMHFPVGFVYHGDDQPWPKNPDGTQETNDVDFVDTFKAMEKLIDLGLVKSIGVSNFNSQQIDRILNECSVKPVSNQVECSARINQKKLIEFCKERDIVLVAYSPLKTPELFQNEKILAIGRKYNKTAPQILLRFLVELGAVPIPKSVHDERITANKDIFDFQLTPDEIATLESFHTGKRLVGLSDAKHAKYWPFGIEY